MTRFRVCNSFIFLILVLAISQAQDKGAKDNGDKKPTPTPSDSSDDDEIKLPVDTYGIVDSNKKACVLAKMDASIVIFTSKGEEDKTAMPDTTEINPKSCPDKDLSIAFKWSNKYEMTFAFGKSKDGKCWLVNSIQLNYRASEKDKWSTISTKDGGYFETPLNQSLKCDKREIELYDDANLKGYIVLSGVQMQAYSFANDNEFGPESLCKAVEPVADQIVYRSDTAPMAVGITFAIISCAVIAGYAVYRSFFVKKVDYGQMGGE